MRLAFALLRVRLGSRWSVALQRIFVIAEIFPRIIQIPRARRVAKRTFLLSSARVLGLRHARGRAEKESAGEDSGDHQDFDKPTQAAFNFIAPLVVVHQEPDHDHDSRYAQHPSK
jgi:hypothetical protein